MDTAQMELRQMLPDNRYMRCLVTALLLVALAQGQTGNRSPAATGARGLADLSLEELMDMTVMTAALRPQSLLDAPATVTVITEQQIRRGGYRNLAEALANVRGFYVSFDGALQYVGARGFSLPGDYNTRFLVMINGHYLTDNVYGAMYLFGEDFGLDMDLVKQIEIVRGPSSALYGSNGVFATVNLITRPPEESPRAQVSTEFGSFGQEKMTVSGATELGGGANLLLSASGFHTSGRTAEFPELLNIGPKFGMTDGVGREVGYRVFANLTWQNWSISAKFSDRRMRVPTGWFTTVFGDPGTGTQDAHNFIDAGWGRQVGKSGQLHARFSYDQFRYAGRFDDPLAGGAVADERDLALGDWVGAELVYSMNLRRAGTVTVGAQTNFDVRNLLQNYMVVPETTVNIDESHPNQSLGLFVQQELNLSQAWTVYLGARYDDVRIGSNSLSPRVAVTYKRPSGAVYKVLYGRSFRNPSPYEQFYTPSPGLKPEGASTIEVAREQRVAGRMNVVTSAYYYRLRGLIEGVPVSENSLQYRNNSNTSASGVELELSGLPRDWLELTASVNLQRTRNSVLGQAPANSPGVVAQIRSGVPLLRRRVYVQPAARYLSSRRTKYDAWVAPVLLIDLTVTTSRLCPSFDVQFGIRNLANRQYSDPLSAEHLTQVMPAAGRSVYVKLIWQRP